MEVCRSELSEISVRAYWRFFESRCTINEWEGACQLTLERETFHAVPMPAVLLGYAQEWEGIERRARQKRYLASPEYAEDQRRTEEVRAVERAEWEKQETERIEERRRYLASPEYAEKHAEEQRQLAAWAQEGEAYREHARQMEVMEREKREAQVLADDLARKALLRRQIQQIMDEEARNHV